MEYITVKNLTKLIRANERTLRRWCKSDKVQYRTVRGVGGNGGWMYEILVSSLPIEIQKKIADKSALELGGNAECSGYSLKNIQSVEVQKDSDTPISDEKERQKSLNNQTKGVCPEFVPNNIIYPYHNEGLTLENEINTTVQSNLKVSCVEVLSEEQAQTLISFGVMTTNKCQ